MTLPVRHVLRPDNLDRTLCGRDFRLVHHTARADQAWWKRQPGQVCSLCWRKFHALSGAPRAQGVPRP